MNETPFSFWRDFEHNLAACVMRLYLLVRLGAGGLFEKMPATQFSLLHAALCETAGSRPPFVHLLAPSDDESNATPDRELRSVPQ